MMMILKASTARVFIALYFDTNLKWLLQEHSSWVDMWTTLELKRIKRRFYVKIRRLWQKLALDIFSEHFEGNASCLIMSKPLEKFNIFMWGLRL